jgi:CubicO group peptidase (beta-lactamase class C family)
MKKLLTILILALSVGGYGQTTKLSNPEVRNVESPLPDSKEGIWLASFIKSFNTGNIDTIINFSRTYNLDRNYVYALYKESGPLSFNIKYDGAYWFQGKITKAWMGFVLREKDLSYFISGVRRGLRPQTAPLPTPIEHNKLNSYLEAYLKASEIGNHFSGAVLLAKNGEIIFEGAYGFSNVAKNKRNQIETQFNLASVTKIFTGVAIVHLAQQGKLQFSDYVSKYIPEYPQHIAEKVTLHHLLTHTSGIEIDNYLPYMESLASASSLNDILEAQIKYLPFLNNGNYDNFEPSPRFDYTNEGIDLLGVIVERASGVSWKTYLQEHIFDRAGMTKTGLLDINANIPGLAKSYSIENGDSSDWLIGNRREVRFDDVSMRFLSRTERPAGSGYSTVKDLLKFVNALQSNILLDKRHLNIMTFPHVDLLSLGGVKRSYGYTLEIAKSYNGLTSFGHSGGAPGMNTVLAVYPDTGYTVIVLSNFDRNAAIHVAEHIRELIMAKMSKKNDR